MDGKIIDKIELNGAYFLVLNEGDCKECAFHKQRHCPDHYDKKYDCENYNGTGETVIYKEE